MEEGDLGLVLFMAQKMAGLKATLSKRNKGKFPTDYVTALLLRGANAPAHGNAEMPVWGPIFAGIDVQSHDILRISNLTHYLESLQAK